jgi:4-hydroxy-2-oxoheptanedioate aldolase
MRNALKDKLAKGNVAVGFGLRWPDPTQMEACGRCGLDFVRIEGEHGVASYQDLAHLVWAAGRTGITPTARVPGNVEHEILHYLDAGIQAITIPHIRSKEDAEQAVRFAKHWPLGRRGDNFPGRASLYGKGLSQREYYQAANDTTMVIALIEDIEGVDAVEQIVRVPGVDAIDVGPYDLGQSMGLPDPKLVDEAVQKVVRAAVGAGLPVGVGTAGTWRNQPNVRKWMEMGCRYFLTGGFFEFGASEAIKVFGAIGAECGVVKKE